MIWKRAAFVAVFVAAAVVWFLVMTGLQVFILSPLLGLVWSAWWGWVIAFSGFFWFTLWALEKWYTWTARGKM